MTPGTESTWAVWSGVKALWSAVSRPRSGRVNRGTGGACPMAYPGAVGPAEAEALGFVDAVDVGELAEFAGAVLAVWAGWASAAGAASVEEGAASGAEGLQALRARQAALIALIALTALTALTVLSMAAQTTGPRGRRAPETVTSERVKWFMHMTLRTGCRSGVIALSRSCDRRRAVRRPCARHAWVARRPSGPSATGQMAGRAQTVRGPSTDRAFARDIFSA